MSYVAVDIGCIESGERSALLGVYKIEEAAWNVCRIAAERRYEKGGHGQHHFLVFDTTNPDDYSEFSCDDFAPAEQARRMRS
jgi:hypothetical protein